MASAALIATRVWVGCPVLGTWARAFVSDFHSPGEWELLHTRAGGAGDITVGLRWCTGACWGPHGHNMRALRPRRGVKTMCEAGGEAVRAGGSRRTWLPVTPGTQH